MSETKPYKGLVLRRGLGGKDAKSAISELQEDLVAVGILLADQAGEKGYFGRATEWAVRDFQIYSNRPKAAQEQDGATSYGSRLIAVDNPVAAEGDVKVDGVVGPNTASRLKAWVAGEVKVPVVVEARTKAGVFDKRFQNLWHAKSCSDGKHRVFVRDLQDEPNGTVVWRPLGRFQAYKGFSGPGAIPPKEITTHTATEEFTPESVGIDWATATAEVKSTFKIIRAVAEQEMLGFYDALNAYDDVVLSFGPCHWVVSNRGSGELWAFFAYLAKTFPDVYAEHFGIYGVEPTGTWEEDGSKLRADDQMKYQTWFKFAGDHKTAKRTRADSEYFRGWHWLHRMNLMTRNSAEVRLATYRMVQIRLRSIMAAPWGGNLKILKGGVSIAPLVSDIVTSEAAVATLLRWHVFRPSHLFSRDTKEKGVFEPKARELDGLELPKDKERNAWNLEAEINDKLRKAIDNTVKDRKGKTFDVEVAKTFSNVLEWPNWANTNPSHYLLDKEVYKDGLSKDFDSYKPDKSVIPGAPVLP